MNGTASEPKLTDTLSTADTNQCVLCGGALAAASDDHFVKCDQCFAVWPRRAAPVEIEPVDFDLPTGLGRGAILRERYRLDALIGAGAQGLTFLAEHQFLRHPCVVKVLRHRVHGESDLAVRRLRGEASNGYGVNSPHVVRVMDADTVDGLWFFVMEYVEGADLERLVGFSKRLAWRQVAQIAVEVAAGLSAIHAAHLVHRDIKPANLLLGVDGRCRVADLGIAQRGAPNDGRWGSTSAEGSRPYMAPEVFETDCATDHRADLYSFGATLFRLLNGRPPFETASPIVRIVTTQAQDVVWPRDAPRDVPDWLIQLILRLLAREREQRYQSAADVRAELATRLSVAGPTPAPSEPASVMLPNGIVIPVFRNVTQREDDDWLSPVLADHLARELAQGARQYIVDRDEFARLTARIRRADQTDRQVWLDAGRLLGAATVIDGSFERAGDRLTVRMSVLQSGGTAAELERRLEGTMAGLAEIQAALSGHARLMLGLSSTRLTLSDPTPPPLAQTDQKRYIAARSRYFLGKFAEAIELALPIAEANPDQCEILGFIGACHAKMGKYELAEEYHRRQEENATRLGQRGPAVEALSNMGAMFYFRGDYDSAYRYFSSAAAGAQQAGMETELAKISNNLGFVLFQLDRREEAKAAYQRAIDTHKIHGAVMSLIGPYNGMGNVLREQGKLAEAIWHHRQALEMAEVCQDRVNVGICHMYLGRCASLQNRLADAKSELAAALNILELTDFWNGLARVYESIAELNLRLGDWAEGLRCADRRIALARQHANRRMESAAWKQRAAALVLAGREDEARQCLANSQSLETGSARGATESRRGAQT